MFSEYIGAALRRAKYESLENGSYMATVEGLRGVIATGETIEKCREDLIEVIEEWIAIRLQRGFAIPSLEGHAIGVSLIGDTVIILPNPHQGEDVDVSLIKTILRDAGISREEWISA